MYIKSLQILEKHLLSKYENQLNNYLILLYFTVTIYYTSSLFVLVFIFSFLFVYLFYSFYSLAFRIQLVSVIFYITLHLLL